MKAVFRREFVSYFTSPIGYIFLGAFFLCGGIFFTVTSISQGTTGLSAMFGLLLYVLIVLIPILTMRTLSDDKRQKTDQILLTSPVNLSGIVMGKFFASLVVYIISVSITLVFAVVVSAFAQPDWTVIFGNIVGLILLGSACIAIGIFASSLTENQVVSAVISFILIAFFSLISAISTVFVNETVIKIFNSFSFLERYDGFTYGQFDLSNVLFFISVTAAFLFFTIRVLERRRWA